MNGKPHFKLRTKRRAELTLAQRKAVVTGEVLAATLRGVGKSHAAARADLNHRADLHLRWLNILRTRLMAVERALHIEPAED